MLSRLEVENFTAFHALNLDFVPGLNVFVGPNATGKTHLLKLLYAVTEAHRFQNDIAQKLLRVFLPEPRRLGRLVRRANQAQSARVRLVRDGHELSFRFSSNQSVDSFSEIDASQWPKPTSEDGKPVFIPPKDMLAHAPGFRSLYDQKDWRRRQRIRFFTFSSRTSSRRTQPSRTSSSSLVKPSRPRNAQSIIKTLPRRCAGRSGCAGLGGRAG